MSAADPKSPPPAPPKAPGFAELAEQSLHALFNPAAFSAAALRPAPSFGAAGGLAAASGALALAINLAHGIVSDPQALSRFPPAIVAAVFVAAMGMYASVLLLGAIVLFALGKGLGGKGDFDRGFQAAAMLSVLVPVQMLCNWFPFAWVLPSLFGAWVAATALEGLYAAPAGPARLACALMCGGALALQAGGRYLTARAAEGYAAARAASDAAGSATELARQVQALQSTMATMDAAPLPTGGGAPTDAAASPAPSAPAPGVSGLDLLRGNGDAAGAAPADGAAAAPSQAAQQVAVAQGLEAQAAGAMNSIMPLLNNPALSRNMTPAQKADMKELTNMMADMQKQAASGRRMTDAEFRAQQLKYQSLVMRVMSSGLAGALPAGRAAAPPAAPASPPAPNGADR